MWVGGITRDDRQMQCQRLSPNKSTYRFPRCMSPLTKKQQKTLLASTFCLSLFLSCSTKVKPVSKAASAPGEKIGENQPPRAETREGRGGGSGAAAEQQPSNRSPVAVHCACAMLWTPVCDSRAVAQEAASH